MAQNTSIYKRGSEREVGREGGGRQGEREEGGEGGGREGEGGRDVGGVD